MTDRVSIPGNAIDPVQPELDKFVNSLFADAIRWGHVCAGQKHLLPILQAMRAAEKYIAANEAFIVAKRHAGIIDMDRAQTARDAALAEWNAAKGGT